MFSKSRLMIGLLAAVISIGVVGLALRNHLRRESPGAAPAVAGDAERARRPDDSAIPPQPPSSIHLSDVTEQTGITFRHTDGSGGNYYIPETVTAGLATFDFDNDGLIDIYFPNGAPLPGTEIPDPPPRNSLYRNLGEWRFVDVTEAAGVACRGFGMGAVAADFDHDGFQDLYVSNFGPKVLYRNNGDGTFTDVTEVAGVADGEMLGAGVCFLDVDGNGNLDLFVANYLQFSYETHVYLTRHGYPEYVGPTAYPAEKLSLYRNNGDGTFADITDESGIGRYPGKGMGVIAADYDQDGATDIFVLNDVFENFLLRNDGTGRFEEVALWSGFKYDGEGTPLGSMGIDCGDYDNDGWLDFYQTSYQRELPVLRRNLGNGLFEDVTVRTRAGQGTLNNVKWGCGFIDFDHDGHRDLFVAMGHLHDLIENWDPPTTYPARNVLLRNTGAGSFVDVSVESGDGMLVEHSSRGAAFDDLDNDGDIDVVILNSRDHPTVLRNQLRERGSTNHWLQVQLRGVTTNRDGVGAHIRVFSGDLMLVAEVHAGRGYQGHFGSRVHFGLGARRHVERIEVRWIGGGREVFTDFEVDQLVTLIEGNGQPVPASDSELSDPRE